MRAAAVAALLILAGLSSACSPSGSGAAGSGEQSKFAGFEAEIPKWRAQIVAADPLCKSQAKDEKCIGFDVACKAERTVTPQERAKGITAHVVTAMSWNGFDPKLKQPQAGSRTVQFTKSASGWTRADHAPVNLSTCADS